MDGIKREVELSKEPVLTWREKQQVAQRVGIFVENAGSFV